MKLDVLIQDPIFQFNLLLWMARDQPESAPRVTPLFQRWGYRFVMIENPVPLPPETVIAAQKSGLDISISPEPEMILGHVAGAHALYLEAKKASFSSTSTTARQARGHMLASGAAFKEIVTPYQSACLCYILPEERRALMEECLRELKIELQANNLSPGETAIHGLVANADGVTYVWDQQFAALMATSTTRELILPSEGEDTDPTPLLLVYSAEDYSGDHPDYAREAMLKQVWSVFLCDVHLTETGLPLQAKAETILSRTTDGIFDFLGRERQKSLCRLIRERLFIPIRDYWNKDDNKRDDIQVSLNGSVLTITIRDPLALSNFTDWLEETRKVRPDYSALAIGKPMTFDFYEEGT